MTKQEIIDSFCKHYLFGYEVFKDGVRQGVAFALNVNKFITLDGYNEGVDYKCAVYAGKKVLDKLFSEYTDVVFTAHREEEKRITLLAELLGFKKCQVHKGFIVLRKDKTGG